MVGPDQFIGGFKNQWGNKMLFDYFLKKVKEQIPHTRIKYGMYLD